MQNIEQSSAYIKTLEIRGQTILRLILLDDSLNFLLFRDINRFIKLFIKL